MIQITRGQTLPPESLIKNLIKLHYEPDFTANRAGVFARRGGVIDLWCPEADSPVRITYDGDEITQLATFDPLNGKSTKSLAEVTVLRSDLAHDRPILAMLSELKPGDYIVHLDHGIGQFVGMETHAVSGVEREYLVLSYAEGDRLLVPIELADKVDRYVGGTIPELHRLSGSNWYQMVLRVKADATAFARDMLETYAKRSIAEAPVMRPFVAEEKTLAQNFKYDLTPDQEKAVTQILNDLTHAHPMDRVLVGDVGFGKTEVAIRAALRAVLNGYQVAVLAPTTILAQQHYDTFTERLKHFPVTIGLLTRFQTKDEQAATIARLNHAPLTSQKKRNLEPKGYQLKTKNSIDIVIGTHRLLGRDVRFTNPGLVIVDEEQKFGVRQKERFKELRSGIHMLSLSATPIPRTLQLALSNMRSISVISTAPEGRTPVATHVGSYDNALIRESIEREINRGGQVYYVHNRVETIDVAGKQLASLVSGITRPDARVLQIAVAHGQMAEGDLARVMHEFDTGKIDILICSTIIENGLDLPNANTLIVDDATRFGLSTLYQLRGRIGRADRQGYAYFFYPQKLRHQREIAEGAELTEEQKAARRRMPRANARLAALLSLTHLGAGPELAMKDLELRGAGAILGRQQHGHVRAIGLGTYLRLLETAVTELKAGTRPPDVPDVIVDLAIPYGIPKHLEPSESRRILLYQQLAHATTSGDLERFRIELTRRFGDRFRVDEQVRNLFRVLEIKQVAADANLHRISQHRTSNGYRITIETLERFSPKQINQLLDCDEHWTIKNERATIDREFLGTDWVATLTTTLRALEE